MVVLLTVTLCLIITVTLAFWPAPQSSGDGKQAGGTAGDTSETADAATVTPPTTLEGELTRQLFAGEINRLQYRRALAKLAERDEEQHPMSVPNNGGSDACP